MKQFEVGDKVRWTSSNTRKEGVIKHVVGYGREPAWGLFKLTHTCLVGGGMRRDHESYLVSVSKGKQKPKMYWPVVSLLEKIA